MTLKLPPLPFERNALEPAISAETLSFHYDKHHNAYFSKTNAAIEDTDLDGVPLEEVIHRARKAGNQGLVNNSSQAWNHTIYWNSLTGAETEPSDALKGALDAAFGGVEGFKEEFKKTGAGHFASGWVWLTADRDGGVKIRDTHDEGSILPEGGVEVPLLVCDLWEHAYYLDRQNDRGAYLDAVVNNLLNWEFANGQFEAARAGKVGWTHP